MDHRSAHRRETTHHREDLMRTAATMYYLEDETMEAVARRLGRSRSSVSRLLKAARDSGMVRIQVRELDTSSGLADALATRFGIEAVIVGMREPVSDADRLDRVARVAAQTLPEWFGDGMTLGVAWGTTIAAIISHLPDAPLTGALVVQLNGSASPRAAGSAFGEVQIGSIARAFNAEMMPFPVPAFFDFPRTKEMMWQERSVQRVLEHQARTDVALFGIGSLHSPVPSHVYTSGYLDDADRHTLAANNVVGDVCTVFLRADGSWRDIAINARATGPTPQVLHRIAHRVAVVASPAKVPALLAALRASAITDLVVDSGTARALLHAAGRPSR